MKRFAATLLTFAAIGASLYATEAAPELNSQYHDSSKCKACHATIVNEWAGSYHAKSHYKHDEYLRQSMEYYARKTRKPINAVKVECAACHNPRVAVTKTDINYQIDVLMGLDEGSEVNAAVSDSTLSEGVNCLVCHNVDSIKHDLPADKRGVHRIQWNPVGIMSGPIEDAKSPYHKTQYRDFFGKDPKQLCFVCHANDRSAENFVFANTQQEYKDTQKQCADCHMSPKKEGFASNLPIDDGKPKKRMVREHGFVGAHTNWLWQDALGIEAKKSGDSFIVTLTNENPHNIPTGFGARELILDVIYRSGSKVIETKSISMTQHYTDKRGKPTIPHLATSATEDMSVPARGTKTFKVPMVEGTGQVTFELHYRLVNDEIRSLLELKQPQWSEKKFINRTTIRL
ncbi:multiheme c-type cytochrome [Sulfurimonas sp. HSL1-2]|uniref:multiheme c-type cytochrome n=1 Tax=Thiomicrolovo zhangzhouensis TaxID=3131933 RepID=UPI0031F86C93